MEIHIIIPVLKPGDKSNVKNYTPISLLNHISKVLERLVYNKVIGHLSNHISNCLFGFQWYKSTLQQLLVYFNNATASKSETDAIYLDIPKHLIAFPITGYWIKSGWSVSPNPCGHGLNHTYLTGRYQCVRINNCLSEVITASTIRGSILGSLLFIILH